MDNEHHHFLTQKEKRKMTGKILTDSLILPLENPKVSETNTSSKIKNKKKSGNEDIPIHDQ